MKTAQNYEYEMFSSCKENNRENIKINMKIIFLPGNLYQKHTLESDNSCNKSTFLIK